MKYILFIIVIGLNIITYNEIIPAATPQTITITQSSTGQTIPPVQPIISGNQSLITKAKYSFTGAAIGAGILKGSQLMNIHTNVNTLGSLLLIGGLGIGTYHIMNPLKNIIEKSVSFAWNHLKDPMTVGVSMLGAIVACQLLTKTLNINPFIDLPIFDSIFKI